MEDKCIASTQKKEDVYASMSVHRKKTYATLTNKFFFLSNCHTFRSIYLSFSLYFGFEQFVFSIFIEFFFFGG